MLWAGFSPQDQDGNCNDLNKRKASYLKRKFIISKDQEICQSKIDLEGVNWPVIP